MKKTLGSDDKNPVLFHIGSMNIFRLQTAEIVTSIRSFDVFLDVC